MSLALEFAPTVDLPIRPALVRHPVITPASARVPARLATVTTLCPPSTPAALAPLRLTRRGVVVVAMVVALLGGLVVWLAALSAPSGAPASSGPAVVTVAPGDTLWSIATRVAPDIDPRAEVETLQRLNRLPDVDLVPGQQVRVR